MSTPLSSVNHSMRSVRFWAQEALTSTALAYHSGVFRRWREIINGLSLKKDCPSCSLLVGFQPGKKTSLLSTISRKNSLAFWSRLFTELSSKANPGCIFFHLLRFLSLYSSLYWFCFTGCPVFGVSCGVVGSSSRKSQTPLDSKLVYLFRSWDKFLIWKMRVMSCCTSTNVVLGLSSKHYSFAPEEKRDWI